MTSPVIDAGDGLPLTVGSLLHARAAEHGERPFLVVDDDTLTYVDAERTSAELARALLGAGLGRGSRVALLHPNGSDFVVGWLAAARIGAVTVPISTFSTSAELVGLLRGADVAAVLSATRYRNHDFPASLSEGIAELDVSSPGPLWSPTVPSLRRISFAASRSHLHIDWTAYGLIALADRVGPDVLAAAEAEVAHSDPMVIVHTSGSTSAPKGVVHTTVP